MSNGWISPSQGNQPRERETDGGSPSKVRYLVGMDLSKNLKKLMRAKDVSAAQLSRATKVAGQTIANWLAGQKPRDITQVKKVADYFDVTVDALCFGAVEKHTSDDPLKKYDHEINAGIFEVVLRPLKKK